MMDEQSFNKIAKARVRKNMSESFRYFWASLALQILVYALLMHVVVRYWGDLAMIASLVGICLYIPFTVVFMKKFKSMAMAAGSVSTFISQQFELLESFYRFKKRYELVLVPLATLIGTFVVFDIWVPGGIWAYPKGALITFFISLVSCIIAIQAENKKSFDKPLSKLKMILDDLNAA
jgi:hypothetical protein